MDNSTDVAFRVTQESDGGYCAKCLTESIFTQGDSWQELEPMIKDAVDCYFFDEPKPRSVSHSRSLAPSECYLGTILLKCGTNSLNRFNPILTPIEIEPRLAANAAVA